jgi:hypothetical protein
MSSRARRRDLLDFVLVRGRNTSEAVAKSEDPGRRRLGSVLWSVVTLG